MVTIVPMTGVIVSVQGTTPGPASGITYTVKVNLPNGSTAEYAGVKPHNTRYPDSIDTVAASNGTAFFVFSVGGIFQYQIIELPATTGCA